MGGKGRKRREKNYRAAHGGPSRLPPPPDASKVDALPNKLRELMSLTSPTAQDPSKDSKDAPREKRNIRGDGDSEKKRHQGNESRSEAARVKDGSDDGHLITQQIADSSDDNVENSKNEKRKKKRKRKEVRDFRFEAENISATRLKRKERKKRYLEAKKNKNKKPKTEDHLDFPGCETIKFGEVVEAPPKLSVPKAFKTNASKERLRLQAVEAYRSRKGWSSRPGLQLPPVGTAPSL